eukprot:TRINITY_DN1539_c0_g1_i5.p1 TRINITY_DN1539_c0_g1~~TRINITY_DN1539_c0_g1_i5.p1  ORF type:complete len:129 (+),score=3.28 TRINITY_DN1539_c0_g1_i5:899-1285(+)
MVVCDYDGINFLYVIFRKPFNSRLPKEFTTVDKNINVIFFPLIGLTDKLLNLIVLLITLQVYIIINIVALITIAYSVSSVLCNVSKITISMFRIYNTKAMLENIDDHLNLQRFGIKYCCQLVNRPQTH